MSHSRMVSPAPAAPAAPPRSCPPAALWVVDRIEAGVAALVRDGDERRAEVSAGLLPRGAREGAVLRVAEPGGRPDWGSAAVDEEERQARLREGEAVLARLKKRDPGGDVVL